MHVLHARSRAQTLLAAGIVGIGVLAGGAWYAGTHGVSTANALDGLTRRVFAQEDPATPQPPAAPPPPAAAKPAAATNSRRPTGQVTQITGDPATFTIQAPDGSLTTYRVLDTTVFMAGHDRPYRFDLVKQGDTVIVRGGALGQGQGRNQAQAPTAPTAAVNARGKPIRRAAPGAVGNGEPIARQVMVRPAGKARPGRQGQGAGAQNGGTNVAGQ